MNDEFTNNKNNKVSVSYVTKKEKPTRQGRDSRKESGPYSGRRRDDNTEPRSKSSRIERPHSVWQTHFKKEEQLPSFEVQESNKEQEDFRRQRQEESRLYGERVCQTLFELRPDSIIKAYFLQKVTPKFRELLSWMASERKTYHVVDEDEMQKITGTSHHEGVCLVVKKRKLRSIPEYLAQTNMQKRDCLLATYQLDNPYNLGALFRSAAFFGCNGVLIDSPKMIESGVVVRVAGGGTEYLEPLVTQELVSSLDELKRAGYTIIGISESGVAPNAIPVKKCRVSDKIVVVVVPFSHLLTNLSVDQTIYVSGKHKGFQLNIAAMVSLLLSEWAQ